MSHGNQSHGQKSVHEYIVHIYSPYKHDGQEFKIFESKKRQLSRFVNPFPIKVVPHTERKVDPFLSQKLFIVILFKRHIFNSRQRLIIVIIEFIKTDHKESNTIYK